MAAMNAALGWALAALLIAIAWSSYGWQGVAFAVTVVIFWLLLQFNRVVRLMKKAADSPIGHVSSAVMFHARLKPGMTLQQLIGQTRSLGRKVSDEPECYEWADASGAVVTVTLSKGRLSSWALRREGGEPPPP
jgi:hypothetical protein